MTQEIAKPDMHYAALRRAELDLSPEVKRAARTDGQKIEVFLLFASGTVRRERMEMYGVSESIIKLGLRLPIRVTMGCRKRAVRVPLRSQIDQAGDRYRTGTAGHRCPPH